MNIFERAAIRIRHNSFLDKSEWLWDLVRPFYDLTVTLFSHKGLKRFINETDMIRVLPKCRGVMEVYEPPSSVLT